MNTTAQLIIQMKRKKQENQRGYILYPEIKQIITYNVQWLLFHNSKKIDEMTPDIAAEKFIYQCFVLLILSLIWKVQKQNIKTVCWQSLELERETERNHFSLKHLKKILLLWIESAFC